MSEVKNLIEGLDDKSTEKSPKKELEYRYDILKEEMDSKLKYFEDKSRKLSEEKKKISKNQISEIQANFQEDIKDLTKLNAQQEVEQLHHKEELLQKIDELKEQNSQEKEEYFKQQKKKLEKMLQKQTQKLQSEILENKQKYKKEIQHLQSKLNIQDEKYVSPRSEHKSNKEREIVIEKNKDKINYKKIQTSYLKDLKRRKTIYSRYDLDVNSRENELNEIESKNIDTEEKNIDTQIKYKKPFNLDSTIEELLKEFNDTAPSPNRKISNDTLSSPNRKQKSHDSQHLKQLKEKHKLSKQRMEAVIQQHDEKNKEMESELQTLQKEKTDLTNVKKKNLVQIQVLEKIIQTLKDEKVKNDESYERKKEELRYEKSKLNKKIEELQQKNSEYDKKINQEITLNDDYEEINSNGQKYQYEKKLQEQQKLYKEKINKLNQEYTKFKNQNITETEQYIQKRQELESNIQTLNQKGTETDDEKEM